MNGCKVNIRYFCNISITHERKKCKYYKKALDGLDCYFAEEYKGEMIYMYV
jgi:hypothetical protein